MKRSLMWRAAAVVTVLVVLAVVACAKATPTPTPRPTNTPTPTPMSGATPTVSPTATPTPTVATAKEAPNPKNPVGKLTIITGEVSADPGINSSGQNDQLYRWSVAETMFRATDYGKWAEPYLVKSYEMAPDNSYVILHLQEGVQFHKDWGEMTAEDMVWSMNDHNAYTNSNSIGQQAGDYAALFYAWEVVDKYTVKAPFQNFDPRWAAALLSLNAQACNVFSKKVYDDKGEEWMKSNVIATGPFQVVDVKLHEKLSVERVPYKHWDKDPLVDKIDYLEVLEETAAIAMLNTGEADAGLVRADYVPDLIASGFKTTSFTGEMLGIFWSGNLWEKTNAITGEPIDTSAVLARPYPWVGNPDNPEQMEKARNARWAVARAIDREAINEQIFAGLGFVIGEMHINPQDPNYDTKWDPTYDLASAKEHLALSGNPDGFTMPIYPTSSVIGAPAIADALTVQLRDMGSKMNVSALKMEYTVFRPGAVTRTTVIPWITWFDEALTDWPFDFPKMATASTITRGGFGLAFEAPEISSAFLKNAKEPDAAKRIETNKALIDFLQYWQLDTGILGVPGILVYNPKSIEDWPHGPDLRNGYHTVPNIIPAR